MLRGLALSLLGLTLLAGPAAARETDGGGAGRRAVAVKFGSAKQGHRGAPLLRRAVYTRPVAGASAACARGGRPSGLRCRGGAVSDTVRGWASGLPPALGVQARECPDDTMATLAEGHDDIVRCMPI